jgi:hypothetical protein
MRSRILAPMWLGLLMVAGCASPAQTVGPRTQVPAAEPGMARVWFFVRRIIRWREMSVERRQ